MDAYTFQKLITDVKDFALIFYFNFAGEPFLNPQLFQMVNEASANDIFTMVDTNATLLSDRRIHEILASQLVENDLDGDLYLIWWVNGKGWHGQSTVSSVFESVYESGDIAIYVYSSGLL